MDDLAALALQVAWGADEALGATARDRRRGASSAPELAATPQRQPPPDTVEAIDAVWRASGGALAVTARHFVGVRGPSDAAVLILGDCPGEAEERSGIAFSGEAGALLDQMMASVALGAADLSFGYVVPWRPPGQRPPSELEVAGSAAFLRARIARRPPRIVVPCGVVAGRVLLGAAYGPRARGRVLTADCGDLALPCLAVQAPEQAMASAIGKARMWAALRLLRRTLDQGATRTAP